MLRRAALLALGLASFTPAAARAQGYDVAPLLDHLRPTEPRDGLAERVGAASLDELELYELHVAVEDELRAFGLREIVHLRNDERAPWPEIALRVFANAVGAPGETPPVSMIAGECLDGVSCTIEQTAPSIIVVRPSAPLAPGARLAHFVQW